MSQTDQRNHQAQNKGFTPTPLNLKVWGFTLLELIFVVLILSVLVGLSTPMFRDTFNNMQFNQSCSDLNSALNFARQGAILNRTEYRLKLDSHESRFWIEGFGRVYYLPKGINIEADAEYLTFYPNGRSDTATITIKSSTNSRIFTTEGTAGYVKIK